MQSSKQIGLAKIGRMFSSVLSLGRDRKPFTAPVRAESPRVFMILRCIWRPTTLISFAVGSEQRKEPLNQVLGHLLLISRSRLLVRSRRFPIRRSRFLVRSRRLLIRRSGLLIRSWRLPIRRGRLLVRLPRFLTRRSRLLVRS